MAPMYVVTQSAGRGPISKRHYVVDGPVDEFQVEAIKEQKGRFVKTVEAASLKSAEEQVNCPACEAAIHFREH